MSKTNDLYHIHIGAPKIDERTEKPTLGIRVRVPMKGMFGTVNSLLKELANWLKHHEIEEAGSLFLRFHVIDMAGEMDIEVGIPVATALPGDDRVSPGVIPAGRYVSLIYSRYALAGNRTLLEWAHANNLVLDRWKDPRGDAFRSRYEAYLTDPRTDPRKSKWEVEVAIKLADAPV